MKTRGALDGNDRCLPHLARPSTQGSPPRPVVDPAGRAWPSLSAAARASRLSPAGVRWRTENGLAGWRFAGPSPAEETR